VITGEDRMKEDGEVGGLGRKTAEEGVREGRAVGAIKPHEITWLVGGKERREWKKKIKE